MLLHSDLNMLKLRVFISSTMEDLEQERIDLATAISHNRLWEAVYAESFVARSRSPREVCLEEVRNSHVYVGIFKKRYGYIPDHDNPRGLSVVVLEYEEAKRNQIPVLIFISKDGSDRESRLAEFLQGVTDFNKGHWRKEYSTLEELIQFVLEAINYEVTRNCLERIEAQRKVKANSIYNLPYFQRLREKLHK